MDPIDFFLFRVIFIAFWARCLSDRARGAGSIRSWRAAIPRRRPDRPGPSWPKTRSMDMGLVRARKGHGSGPEECWEQQRATPGPANPSEAPKAHEQETSEITESASDRMKKEEEKSHRPKTPKKKNQEKRKKRER